MPTTTDTPAQHVYEAGGLAIVKTTAGFTVYQVASGKNLAKPFREASQAYAFLHAALPIAPWDRPYHRGLPWETKEPLKQAEQQARELT